MAVLEPPLSLKTSVPVPRAVLFEPVVLSSNAAAPTAVLESALLRINATAQTPVLKLPVVSEKSERQPSAVFPAPMVSKLSASHPSAVVKFGKHPSGAGLIARAPGKSAKQVKTGRMAINIVLRFFIFLISFSYFGQLVHNYSGSWLTHFELGIHFLHFRDLLLELGGERLYLLLLLRDRCLQVLNLEVEHRLLGGIGNGLGPDAFGRKSTRIGPVRGDRAQSSIRIDHHGHCRRCGNRRTMDIVDKASVTFLAKHTVHTSILTVDDVVIGGG